LWNKIVEHLKGHPERIAVAKVIIENGLAVKDGRVYCNEIEIPSASIARVARVDRRTVSHTIESIEGNTELQMIFKHLRSAGHSLKDIAKYLGFGVVEITVDDARKPGILASAAGLLAEEKIGIRQAIVDDPDLSPEPKLTLVVETSLSGDILPRMLKIEGVKRVSIY
jgi:predicted regulator of amino acid metabolism with ACT domain